MSQEALFPTNINSIPDKTFAQTEKNEFEEINLKSKAPFIKKYKWILLLVLFLLISLIIITSICFKSFSQDKTENDNETSKKPMLGNNCQDSTFFFGRNSGITEPREKLDASSVYLDLSNANPKGEVVRVYIIDSSSDIIRSYGGDFFRCELGKKYFLYNTVKEKGGKNCRIWITGNSEPISGKWSPDSVNQKDVITLEKAYAQSDDELVAERATDVHQVLFKGLSFKFKKIGETYSARYGNFLIKSTTSVSYSLDFKSKIFCFISHSYYVYGKGYVYDVSVTMKDSGLDGVFKMMDKLIEDPKSFFESLKFATRDGSITITPLEKLGIKIIVEFKRHPSKNSSIIGAVEIEMTYLDLEDPLKKLIFEKVESLWKVQLPNFTPFPMERAFLEISPSVIMVAGFYLLFEIVELALIFA